MRKTKDGYQLSSGRKIYANHGIIGLSLFEKNEWGNWDFGLSHGYDGGIDGNGFSPEELVEISSFMVEQWSHYRYRASKGIVTFLLWRLARLTR